MAKAKLFDVGHVAQLHEIQKSRLKQGFPGIGDEIDELIRRLTSGGVAGKSDDPRIIQAKRLWDLGFGRELGRESFEEYLADIPKIPEGLVKNDPEFLLLTLCDPRPGLIKSCKLIGISFGFMNEDVVPCFGRPATPQTPFWVRFHGGHKNRNRRPTDCLNEYTGNTFAGTAVVGIMAYCHFPEIIKENEHILDLPGSVIYGGGYDFACLDVWDGRPRLGVRGHDDDVPFHGSGGFRRE